MVLDIKPHLGFVVFWVVEGMVIRSKRGHALARLLEVRLLGWLCELSACARTKMFRTTSTSPAVQSLQFQSSKTLTARNPFPLHEEAAPQQKRWCDLVSRSPQFKGHCPEVHLGPTTNMGHQWHEAAEPANFHQQRYRILCMREHRVPIQS